MNKLETQLSVVLEKALTVAEKTGEFVIEQAPQLLQEFYLWHTSKYILGVVLGIVFLLLARFLSNIWSVKDCGDSKDWTDVVLFGRVGEGVSMIIPFILFGIVGIVTLIVNIYNLIFIYVAPKIYLIDYFVK